MHPPRDTGAKPCSAFARATKYRRERETMDGDFAVELQNIYDSEINIGMSWMWDGGITLRLGDEIGGYIAEETVESVAGALPWFQEAIAHFYPTSAYAQFPWARRA
jgi:hypothetical protein